ncbi:DUF805 domain-containing protein [Demequina aurantiaca]|uniref:DUF805 domain-containing protein n=1 Tax=Demequina aurantiaca TaxID=676200 RepID=UPI0007809803|nr:DUF805 domain-containing protein [Demequina aurantiaca]
MNGFKEALSKYAKFSGRSRRREFWGFHITVYLIGLVIFGLIAISAAISDGEGTFSGPLAIVGLILAIGFGLYIIIPSLSVAWRRYQDVGLPGALVILGLIIPLITLIVGFIPGKTGETQYGADPKA